MTEQVLNQLTRRVMLDAVRLEYDPLETEPHAFSPAFERRMKRLLRRGRHPVWHKTLHAAACLLLALLLSGCAVLAVSPEAREVFSGWVREVHETYFLYHFETSAEDCPVKGDEIPQGLDAGKSVLTCEDGKGGRLTITYAQEFDVTGLRPDECKADAVSVLVGEDRAFWFPGREGTRHLVWVDGESGVFFWISGPLAGEELIRIGEGMEKREKPPLEITG